MSVLVAGANRFVGISLCKCFAKVGGFARSVIRSLRPQRFDVGDIEICSLQSEMDWTTELKCAQQAVYLASWMHAKADKSSDLLSKLRRTNLDETVSHARHAVATSLRRFITLGTIKVNGEFTAQGCPLSVADAPAPEDSYGVSEQEAEGELHRIAMDTGFDSMMRQLVHGILLLQKTGAVPLHWIIGPHRSSLA